MTPEQVKSFVQQFALETVEEVDQYHFGVFAVEDLLVTAKQVRDVLEETVTKLPALKASHNRQPCWWDRRG